MSTDYIIYFLWLIGTSCFFTHFIITILHVLCCYYLFARTFESFVECCFPFPQVDTTPEYSKKPSPSSPGDTSCQRCTDPIQPGFNLRFDSIIFSWIELNPLCNWPIPKLNWKCSKCESNLNKSNNKTLWIQMNQDFKCSVSFTQFAFFSSKVTKSWHWHMTFFRIICSK